MTRSKADTERAKTLTNESLFLARSLYEAHWTAPAHRDKGYVCPNCLVYLRLVESIKALESELAQRRERDAEIAKRLEKGLSTAIGPRHVWDTNISRTGYLPKKGVIIIRKIINDLEATPTPAQKTTR